MLCDYNIAVYDNDILFDSLVQIENQSRDIGKIKIGYGRATEYFIVAAY